MTAITPQQLFDLVKQIPVPTAAPDVQAWLQSLVADHLQENQLEWLLAHTFGGIVWGKFENGRWLLSGDFAPTLPQLSPDNIMELRLFSRVAELYLWRAENGLTGRLIIDDPNAPLDTEDEQQILWGTDWEVVNNTFSRMTDGEQRLLHMVPIAISRECFADAYRPLRLHVRHYVTRHPETGLARITMSRLWHLEAVPQNNKENNNGS